MQLSANITRSLAQDLKVKVKSKIKIPKRRGKEEKEQEKEESRKNLEKQNLNVFVKRKNTPEKGDIRRKEEKPEDNLFSITVFLSGSS